MLRYKYNTIQRVCGQNLTCEHVCVCVFYMLLHAACLEGFVGSQWLWFSLNNQCKLQVYKTFLKDLYTTLNALNML